jgi:hypothetical protein
VENGVQEAYVNLFDLIGQPVKCNDIESKQFIPEIVRVLLDELFDQKFYVKFRNRVEQVSLLLLFGNDVGPEERKIVYEGLRIDGFAELRSLVQAVEAVKYFQSSPRYNWSRETDAMVVLSDNLDLSIKCFALSDYHLTFERHFKGKGRDPRFEWAVRKLWKDVQSETFCEEKECVSSIEKQLYAFLTSGRSELTSLKLPDGIDYQVFLNRERYNVYAPPDATQFASLISDVVSEVGLKYETTGIVLQGFAAANKFFRESFNQFDPVSDETPEFRNGIRNYILKQFLGGVPVVCTEHSTGVGMRGIVTSEGGSKVNERGVCWSLNHEPTINDSHVQCELEGDSFSMNLIGLSEGKVYYVRAYAVNSLGVGYGNEIEITLSEDGSNPEEGFIGIPEAPIGVSPLPPEKDSPLDPNDNGNRKFKVTHVIGGRRKRQTLTVKVEILDDKALPFDCVFTLSKTYPIMFKPESMYYEECESGAKGELVFGPYTLPISALGNTDVIYAGIWPAREIPGNPVFKNNKLEIKL